MLTGQCAPNGEPLLVLPAMFELYDDARIGSYLLIDDECSLILLDGSLVEDVRDFDRLRYELLLHGFSLHYDDSGCFVRSIPRFLC